MKMTPKQKATLRQAARGEIQMVRNSNPRGVRTRDAVNGKSGSKVNLQLDFLLDNNLVEVVSGWSDYAPRKVKLTERGEKFLALYAM